MILLILLFWKKRHRRSTLYLNWIHFYAFFVWITIPKKSEKGVERKRGIKRRFWFQHPLISHQKIDFLFCLFVFFFSPTYFLIYRIIFTITHLSWFGSTPICISFPSSFDLIKWIAFLTYFFPAILVFFLFSFFFWETNLQKDSNGMVRLLSFLLYLVYSYVFVGYFFVFWTKELLLIHVWLGMKNGAKEWFSKHPSWKLNLQKCMPKQMNS